MAFVSAPLLVRSPQLQSSFCGRSTVAPRPAPRIAVNWRCAVTAPTNLKKYIVDDLKKLDYGRKIAKNPAAQRKIDEKVQELEQLNPTLNPVYDDKINGKWLILYTTSKSILGITRPKPFRPNFMLQTIDSPKKRIYNKEKVYLGPIPITTAVEALITNTTATRVTVRFLKFIFFGFLSFSVRDDGSFTGWQDITYLDDDLRISRGNEGNLFVLERAK